MKTQYLPTFIKDLKSLKSTPVYKRIKNFVFQEILAYQNLDDISNLKKLKSNDSAYRIRFGDYRVGFFLQDDIVTFYRVLHRREFYRYFP